MEAVNIPEPCHENWNEMTPTQKGAFCGKCAIDVVDFSKMSNEEVKLTLLEKKGQHLCGRFGNSQLDEINAEEAWKSGASWKVYLSKFVAALVLSFGVTLFNGIHAQEEEKIHFLGMIVYEEQPDTLIIEEIKSQEDTTVTIKCETDESKHRKGKVKVNKIEVEEEEIRHTKGEVQAIEFIQGDIDINYVYSVDVDEEKDVEIEKPIESNDSEHNNSAGEVKSTKEAITPRYRLKSQVNNTQKPLKSYKLETSPMPIPNPQFDAKIFPNPTSTQSELVLKNEVAQNFDILLFAADGKIINTIHSGELLKGEQRFSINLSDLNSGIYYVQIITSKGAETIKLQKVQ